MPIAVPDSVVIARFLAADHALDRALQLPDPDPRKRAALADYRAAVSDMARQRLGAGHHWGILSDSAELTCQEVAATVHDTNPALAQHLNQIAVQLPAARIAAHRGQPNADAEVSEQLASCFSHDMDDLTARRLVHHLPGAARPIPELRITEITPGGRNFARRFFGYCDLSLPLSEIDVSLTTSGALYLHYIGVRDDYVGRGAGTAALEHLTRTADHYQLAITGEIGGQSTRQDTPLGRHQVEANAERLTRWYQRHGFTITPTRPGGLHLAKIDRPSHT